jgi:hypothetical protein
MMVKWCILQLHIFVHLMYRMIAELRSRLRAASSSESDVEMVAPIELLLRAAETKRNHCVDSINKTQLAIHKAVKVEEVGDKFKRELDWLRRNLADSPLREAEQRLKVRENEMPEAFFIPKFK